MSLRSDEALKLPFSQRQRNRGTAALRGTSCADEQRRALFGRPATEDDRIVPSPPSNPCSAVNQYAAPM